LVHLGCHDAVTSSAGRDLERAPVDPHLPHLVLHRGLPFRMQDRRGPEHRVSGERQLLLGREDAGIRAIRRDAAQEDRLELPQLPGDPVHGVAGQRVGAHHHRQAVPRERLAGEDVDVVQPDSGVRGAHGRVSEARTRVVSSMSGPYRRSGATTSSPARSREFAVPWLRRSR
jgi:hypothetical protein